MKLINIGFGNMVSAERLVAVVSPDSAPIKRVIKEAREQGRLIDASYGRSTRGRPHHGFGPRGPVGPAAGDGGEPRRLPGPAGTQSGRGGSITWKAKSICL